MVVQNTKRDFFAKLDTPLSSVLCNCCQVSCMIPNRTLYCTYNTTSTATTSKWMELMVQEITTTNNNSSSTFTLRDVVLPGTHDSGSGTISAWKPFSAAGRTQNYSLYEQLSAGIRYLDVRVANGTTGGDDVLSIWHGCLEGDNFATAIQGIADFVNQNKNEMIICEIVPEYNKSFNGNQKRNCLDIIRTTIGSDHIIPADQIRNVIENTSFVQVMNSMSQRVIVLLHNRFFEDNSNAMDINAEQIASQYNFGTSEEYLRNAWNDTRDCTVLMEKNLQTVQQFVNFRGKLVSNQFVCTPGISGGIPDIIGLLTGKNSLRPVSYACRLYGPNMLDTFLCTNAHQPWNIVALDFIDLCPEITDFLIALNWKYVTTMKVLFAAVTAADGTTNTDVTTKIQSYVYCNTVLFLPDPITNLATQQSSDDSYTLTVAYSLSPVGDTGDNNNNKNKKNNKTSSNDTTVKNCVITMDVSSGDTPILIAPSLCHNNEGSMMATITEDNGSTGVVYRGKVYTTKAEVPNSSGNGGAIIEYSIENSHCQFSMG